MILDFNVTSYYWSKYFLISDSVIVKSKISLRWITFPCLLQVRVEDQNSSSVGIGKSTPSKHMKIQAKGETELLQ